MRHPRTSILLATLLLALAVACNGPVAPTVDDEPSEYELVMDILSQPVDATTGARINVAQGKPADTRRDVFQFAANWPGTIPVTFANIRTVKHRSYVPAAGVAADGGDNPDARCEFINGGTAEQYREFRECEEAADDDPECNAVSEDLRVHILDEEGVERVILIGFHVHCVEEDGGGDPH